MTLPLPAHKKVAGRSGRCSFESVMTFTREGLVLGDAVLAPLRSERDGAPEIAIDGAEERILALLAVAYGKTVLPGILGNIRRAARYWHSGENELAAIEIALSGLPPLARKGQASLRLFLGEQLLAEGLSPHELIKTCGHDPAPVDFIKAGYHPDQPRVPAGNPGGGQWSSGETSAAVAGEGAGSSMPPPGQPSSAAGGRVPPGVKRVDPNIEFVGYTPVQGLPNDAVVVKTPNGKTIPDPDSKTKKLMAPPYADFREVYAAGQAIASLPLPEQYSKGHAAIAQGGIYDFQRDVKRERFYDDYIHAANYAVGVYMSGAGYSLPTTLFFAKLYALRNSSNYDAQDQLGWIKRGWHDGKTGMWK